MSSKFIPGLKAEKAETVKERSVEAAEKWECRPHKLDPERESYAEGWEAGFWEALRDFSSTE